MVTIVQAIQKLRKDPKRNALLLKHETPEVFKLWTRLTVELLGFELSARGIEKLGTNEIDEVKESFDQLNSVSLELLS